MKLLDIEFFALRERLWHDWKFEKMLHYRKFNLMQATHRINTLVLLSIQEK